MIRRLSGVHTGNQSWPGSSVRRVSVARPQVPDPDVVLLIVAVERDARPVGREARMLVGARRRGEGSSLPVRSTHTSVRAFAARLPGTSTYTSVPSAAMAKSPRAVCRCGEPRQHRHRRAVRLQPIRIEGDRAQRSRRDVDQVAAGHVVPVAPAAQQHFLRSGAQIAHRHLGRLEPARLRRDREEDGAAAGQDFRPEVVGFALRVVGPRQHLRRPPAADTRCSPVAGLPVAKMIVSSGAHVAPRGVAVEAGERDRRAAGDRDLPERAAVGDEADPLAIRRDERPAQLTALAIATGSSASSARTKSCVPSLPT